MPVYLYKCIKCEAVEDIKVNSFADIENTKVMCDCGEKTPMKRIPAPFDFSFAQAGHR